jgi:hypothetical protein
LQQLNVRVEMSGFASLRCLMASTGLLNRRDLSGLTLFEVRDVPKG